MKSIFIILVIFMCGCVQDVPVAWESQMKNYQYSPAYTDIVYVGDSNCIDRFVDPSELPWVIAGISGDCVSGRKLIDVESLPGVRIVFLALGLNDSPTVKIDDYTIRLNQLLSSTSATVYCVLPILENGFTGLNVDPFVNSMIGNCSNIINPIDYGVTAGHGDGSHWTSEDMRNFSLAIVERL